MDCPLFEFLKNNHFPDTVRKGVCDLAELVLKRNVFEFGNELFLQLLGTAIGTKMAPNFSNVFMDKLERSFFQNCSQLPSVWWRYIDDIFAIWPWGEDSLIDFMTRLNAFHPNVKFTFEYSNSSVHFLDVNVMVDPDRELITDLYIKSTDMHQFLLASSSH